MSNHEYWCGCESRLATDCRCMRGYTLPRRLSERARDFFMFGAGALVAAIIVFGVMA